MDNLLHYLATNPRTALIIMIAELVLILVLLTLLIAGLVGLGRAVAQRVALRIEQEIGAWETGLQAWGKGLREAVGDLTTKLGSDPKVHESLAGLNEKIKEAEIQSQATADLLTQREQEGRGWKRMEAILINAIVASVFGAFFFVLGLVISHH